MNYVSELFSYRFALAVDALADVHQPVGACGIHPEIKGLRRGIYKCRLRDLKARAAWNGLHWAVYDVARGINAYLTVSRPVLL